MESLAAHSLSLPVMEDFYTLQGEGFHQGRAAYFVRLGGCDVGCVWCDVKESWNADDHPKHSVSEIVDKIRQQGFPAGTPKEDAIVVITGGEPLMHRLDELTTALKEAGFRTHIETSGSSPLSGYWDWICFSPKKFKAPLPEIYPLAHELKVVVFNKSDFAWAEKFAALVSPGCRCYLQPEWDKHQEIIPLIIKYIKDNPRWELSLQLHKYINVP